MADTFGQIKFRLAKLPHGAGVDHDVLEGIINDRYQEILRHYDWSRLKEIDAILQTTAIYETGTISIANGATSGTGTGTAFTSGMSGRRIRVEGRNESYAFTYVGAGSFTVDRPYEGEDVTDAGYKLFQSIYALASDAGEIQSFSNPALNLDLDQSSREDLDKKDPARLEYGDPCEYVLYEDNSSNIPQVELWPIPEDSIGLPYWYRKTVAKLTATSDVILPWVSTECLIAGCEASLYDLKPDLNMSAYKERRFQYLLSEMVKEDSGRKVPTRLRMNERYTAHRRQRAAGNMYDVEQRRRQMP